MERAGKKIDKAVENTSEAIKDAGKKKDEKKDQLPSLVEYGHPVFQKFRRLQNYYPTVSTENTVIYE